MVELRNTLGGYTVSVDAGSSVPIANSPSSCYLTIIRARVPTTPRQFVRTSVSAVV